MNDRYEKVLGHVTGHLLFSGMLCEIVEMGEWDPHLDHLYAPFGITAVWQEGAVVALFCPELVTKVTEDLDDEALGNYLDAIEFQLDFFAAHFDYTREQAFEAVDRLMAEVGFGSLQLINRVQIDWLDQCLAG